MYKSKREEIESLAEENLRRKRQRRAYAQLEAKIRKDIEAEYKANRHTPYSPPSMPKILILLTIVNGLLTAGTLWLSIALTGESDLIKYGIIFSLVSIPTVLILLYIGYIFMYLMFRVYWWWHLLWTLFYTLGIVYGFVSALSGHMVLADTINRMGITLEQWYAQFQTPLIP